MSPRCLVKAPGVKSTFGFQAPAFAYSFIYATRDMSAPCLLPTHPPLLPSTNVGSCYFPVTEPYNRVLAWTDIDAISQGEDCFNTP